ncbi:ficolin-1-like [Musca vetustissima]|uniref:ficolin-1-like n=1 Tax=Musca vetustissima TaxID=27455 RepID=UPI002AB61FBD|nr:ficolin-1-like [Musca vetustissima]
MRCEDSVGNVHADWETQKLIKDVDDIKNTIENMQLRKNAKDLAMFDIRVDTLPYKCHTHGPYSSCAEITACTERSGYYYVRIPQFSKESILVECDAHTEGGDWTVIQRREDGSGDFYRTWNDYKMGFGELDGEFFIGMDKLFALTNYQGPQELLILMVNGTNEAKGYAKYDSFKIANEGEKYKLLQTGQYTGTAGDSLKSHIGMKFTTKDQDNDLHAEGNCAVIYMGAWWYSKCHSSNLNGHYGDKSYAKGVDWYSFSGHYNSLTYVKMMLRRKRG